MRALVSNALVKRGLMAALFVLSPMAAHAQEDDEAANLRADAEAILDIIDREYAYLDRFGGQNPARGAMGVDVEAVNTPFELLTFAECALNALKDHHAFTGPSTDQSPGLAPSYSDLWIDYVDGDYVIGEVRADTPAQRAGVRPGWELVTINGDSVDDQIDQLCGGPYVGAEERGFAARMVAIGPRHLNRQLGFETPEGERVDLELIQLYAENKPWPGPLTHEVLDDGVLVLTVNDALGENGWRAAVEAMFADISPSDVTGVVLDLRDTPGGGGTDNARALLGRFVDERVGYQRHEWPLIERSIGVPRSWMEEVSPLQPSLADIPVVVLVGRWTGSMGEGTAIGFQAAADATIVGTQMAQLLGAVNDLPLPNTGWTIKLPTERLYHVDRTPREDIMPDIVVPDVEANPTTGEDRGLDAALTEVRRQIAEG